MDMQDWKVLQARINAVSAELRIAQAKHDDALIQKCQNDLKILHQEQANAVVRK